MKFYSRQNLWIIKQIRCHLGLEVEVRLVAEGDEVTFWVMELSFMAGYIDTTLQHILNMDVFIARKLFLSNVDLDMFKTY